MKTNIAIWGIVQEQNTEYHYIVIDAVMSEQEAKEIAARALKDGFDFQGNKIIPDKVGIIVYVPNTYPETPTVLKQIIITL